MTYAIPFPLIDPVIFQLGPIALKWYGLAYAVGLLAGIYLLRRLSQTKPIVIQSADADEFLSWACLGIIIGGRLGYVFFYNIEYFFQNPISVLYIWEGGMSFHGGFLGVVLTSFIFTYIKQIRFLRFCDMLSCVSPIGLFFGRVANFINQELVGRVTEFPLGVVFPMAGPQPRHPSQLYEAFLEGIILFVITNVLWRNNAIRNRPGFTAGVFVGCYGLFRAFAEIFRQPDEHIGYLSFGSTMGQWLSAPMVLLAFYLIFSSKKDRVGE